MVTPAALSLRNGVGRSVPALVRMRMLPLRVAMNARPLPSGANARSWGVPSVPVLIDAAVVSLIVNAPLVIEDVSAEARSAPTATIAAAPRQLAYFRFD